jgi:hypothetical protein
MRFTVVDELVLVHAPDLVRGDVMILGDVLKLTGDCAEDAGEDDGGLHAIPYMVIDGRSIREGMVDEFVALQGEQNLRANVLYPTGLFLEHGGDGGVTP